MLSQREMGPNAKPKPLHLGLPEVFARPKLLPERGGVDPVTWGWGQTGRPCARMRGQQQSHPAHHRLPATKIRTRMVASEKKGKKEE